MGDTVNEGSIEHSPPTKEMSGEEMDVHFPPLPPLPTFGISDFSLCPEQYNPPFMYFPLMNMAS